MVFKKAFVAIFGAVMLHRVRAFYDPLLNGTRFSPDIAKAQQEYRELVDGWRKDNSEYQFQYNYAVDFEKNPDSSSSASCLHFPDDTLLQQLRVGYLLEGATAGRDDRLTIIARDPDFFRLTVPNVGTYYGVDSAEEYMYIAEGMANARFSTFIDRGTVEQVPRYVTRDVLASTTVQIIMWNQGTKTEVLRIYDELEFRPCSVALEGLVYTFEDAAIHSFMEQRFSNRYLCGRIQSFCTGENQQYESTEDCISFMNGLPDRDASCNKTAYSALSTVNYSLQGNSSACRFLHHFMAAPDFSPETHCPHIGKDGGPDPNDQFKCSPANCMAQPKLTPQGQVCKSEWKQEAEAALVGALPSCLQAISGGVCTAECKQALSQFALSGYTQSSDFSKTSEGLSLRARACICSNKISENPLSTVLRLVPFSPLTLLEACGAYDSANVDVDPCLLEEYAPESKKSVVSWTEEMVSSSEFLQHILEAIVERSVDLVRNREEKTPTNDILLIDLEYVKYFAGGANFHHLLPATTKTAGCPFFHGPIVGSYQGVLGLLNSIQERSKNNFFLNPDFPISNVPAANLFDTGSQAHKGIRAVIREAFPVLSRPVEGPDKLIFTPLSEETLQQLSALLLNTTAPSKELVSAAVENIIKYLSGLLFPEASRAFIDELTIYAKALIPTVSALSISFAYHAVAGQGILRVNQMFARKAAKMIESYFGPEKMKMFVNKIGQESSVTTNGLSVLMAQELVVGFGSVFVVLTTLFRRMLGNPCEMLELFKKDPIRFVLEELRLTQLPLGGNHIIGINETYGVEYNGESVVYSGGQEWKSGSKFAVQYSLTLANRDGHVFSEPDKFDPARPNLNNILTFGAPEYLFHPNHTSESQSGPGARSCIAHNLAVALLVKITDQILSQHKFCYERQYSTAFDLSVVVMCVVVLILIGVGVSMVLYLWFVVRPLIKAFAIEIVTPNDDERSQLDAAHFERAHSCDADSCHLYLRNVSLYKTKKTFCDRGMTVAEKVILEGLNLQISAGSLTGLMGGSGDGKTSLLNAIARFYSPRLIACGDIVSVSEKTNSFLGCAYVHHNHKSMLFEDLTGIENLVVGSIVRMNSLGSSWTQALKDFEGGRGDTSNKKVMRYLVGSMKLHKCLQTKVKDMSSGEKRRLSIAIECLKPSRLVLLDEPLSGLDSAVALETVNLLKTMASKLGKMMIMIVHQPSEAIFEALDDLILLRNGRCVYAGPREVALERLESNIPGHDATKTLPEKVLELPVTHSEYPPMPTTPGDEKILDATPLAPFHHRLMACVLVSWFSLRDRSVLYSLFLYIPAILLFVAVYNIGPDTAPPEAIVLVNLLICGPIGLMLQLTSSYQISRIMSYVQMKRCGIFSGVDYTLQLTVFYSLLAVVMCLILYPTCLVVGLSEILTSQRLIESLAIASGLGMLMASLQFFCILLVSKPHLSESEFFAVNYNAVTALYAWGAIGWVFSGLLYRFDTTSIPYLYDIVSATSPSYWAGMGLLVSVFEGAIFGGCSGYDNKLPCLGDTFLLLYGLDEQQLVPGFSIWILLLALCGAVGGACVIAWRPWAKQLKFVEPQKIVRCIQGELKLATGSSTGLISASSTVNEPTAEHRPDRTALDYGMGSRSLMVGTCTGPDEGVA